MRERILIAVIVGVVLCAGCSPGKSAAPAAGSTEASTAAASSGEARGSASYPALTPETAGEKKAAASIGLSYKAYLAASEQQLKQNPSIIVYRDGATVKPRLIGYKVAAYTDKKANGKFDTATILVLNGTVTSDGAWHKSGELQLSDINQQYFTYEIPSIFETPLTATSEREKEAVAKARAWCDANLAAKALTRFDLAGYTFAWGQPSDEHALMMQVRPDNPGYYQTVAQ